MLSRFKKIVGNLFSRKKKDIKLGLYGPPNGGKTTLANTICKDFFGDDFDEGQVSKLAHETREVVVKEQIELGIDGKKLRFNLVDTPGIATKIDYEDFIKAGLAEDESKKRAKEATKGVIESIKWLDEMDSVVVVLDSTRDPFSQVNITILGNLAARKIPVVIAANKIDMKKSNVKRVKAAFPQYPVIGISAKAGTNIDDLYREITKILK